MWKRARVNAKILPLIAVLSLLLGGCRYFASTGVNKDDGYQNPESNSTKFKVTREDAIRIATEIVRLDTDLSMTDVLVRENESSWTVSFVLKPNFQNRLGGGAWVEVDKVSGEVLQFYFDK